MAVRGGLCACLRCVLLLGIHTHLVLLLGIHTHLVVRCSEVTRQAFESMLVHRANVIHDTQTTQLTR